MNCTAKELIEEISRYDENNTVWLEQEDGSLRAVRIVRPDDNDEKRIIIR